MNRLQKKTEELRALQQEFEALADLYINGVDPVPMWKTGNGSMIEIRHMDEEHLRNAIAWAQRRLVYNFGTQTWISQSRDLLKMMAELLKEAERRGMKV